MMQDHEPALVGGNARYYDLIRVFPYRVEVEDTGAKGDSEWWRERSEWIRMNHPGVRWDFIYLGYSTGVGDVRHVIMFGFADRSAAVHFAIRWKGE